MKVNPKREVDRYHIFVGLGDKDTGEQKFDTGKYVKVMDFICKSNKISYTLEIKKGRCYQENSAYVSETSLDIMIIDAESSLVEEIAAELCAMFGQESVMITRDKTEMYYVYESI